MWLLTVEPSNIEGVGDVVGAGAAGHEAQHLDLARRQLPNRIR